MNELCIHAIPMRRTFTIASGEYSKCMGVLKSVPVLFDGIITEIKFISVDVLLVNILIGMNNLERLQGIFDRRGQFIDFKIIGKDFRTRVKQEPDAIISENEAVYEYFASKSS